MECVVWGATGHCRVVAEVLLHKGHTIAAVVDRAAVAPPLDGVDLLVGQNAFDAWLLARGKRTSLGFVVAIGGGGGADRLAIHDSLTGRGLAPVTVQHRFSHVSETAEMADGVQVLAGAVVNPAARLGRQTIVNTRASVDHDTIVGEGVHIAPGATICGAVTIGDETFVAAGATVLPRVKVGKACLVGAGALVTRDVPDGAQVRGVPAHLYP